MTTEYSAKDIVVVRQLDYNDYKKHLDEMSEEKKFVLKNGWKHGDDVPFVNRLIPRKYWPLFLPNETLEGLTDEQILKKYGTELGIGMAPYRYGARFYNARLASEGLDPLDSFCQFLRDTYEVDLKERGLHEEKLIFFNVYAPGGMFLEYESKAVWLHELR